MRTTRPLGLLLLPLLTACPPTPVGPTPSTNDTEDTDGTEDSVPLLDDSGPVETGWPVPTGEDVALIDPDERAVWMFFNDEQQIASTHSAVWSIPESGADVLLCDFDGDGLDDVWLLTGGSGALRIAVYANEGGEFAREAVYEVTPGFNASNYSYACGDLNGSGKADLFAFKKDVQKGFVYANTGGALDTESPVKTSIPTSSGARFLAADVDGDGRDELGAHWGSSFAAWRVSEGSVQTSSEVAEATIPDGYEVAALDLDADELADLAIWNGAAFVVWPGTGAGFDNTRATAFILEGGGEPAGASLR